jgi:hypothetical protein
LLKGKAPQDNSHLKNPLESSDYDINNMFNNKNNYNKTSYFADNLKQPQRFFVAGTTTNPITGVLPLNGHHIPMAIDQNTNSTLSALKRNNAVIQNNTASSQTVFTQAAL